MSTNVTSCDAVSAGDPPHPATRHQPTPQTHGRRGRQRGGARSIPADNYDAVAAGLAHCTRPTTGDEDALGSSEGPKCHQNRGSRCPCPRPAPRWGRAQWTGRRWLCLRSSAKSIGTARWPAACLSSSRRESLSTACVNLMHSSPVAGNEVGETRPSVQRSALCGGPVPRLPWSLTRRTWPDRGV
jgi:hypothetical protein